MESENNAANHEVITLIPEGIEQFGKEIDMKVKDLSSFHKNVLKKLSHYQYPFDAYFKCWEWLQKSLHKKLQYLVKRPEFPFIVSDAVNWIMPNICTSYNDINAYIKKYLEKEDRANKDEEAKSAWTEFSEGTTQKYQVDQAHEEDILMFPLKLVSDLLIKIQVFFSYLDQSIEKMQNLLKEEQIEEIRVQLRINCGRLKIQRQNLENSLKLFNKNIDLIKSQAQHINKDNSILRHRIISNQFHQVKKSNKYLVKYGCRLKFIVKLKQRAKKVQKRLNDRKMYILQIIDGQQKYIKGLEEYIDYIKKPIQQLQTYSKEEISKLFSTIEQIRKFHISFAQQLRDHYANYSKYQVYGDIMKKNIPYFKLYLDYIYNAQAAQKLLMHLQATNDKVADICRKYMSEKEKVAANELMQPTFKIARYEMLMQDIIKKTNPDHPDYAKMSDAKDYFKKNLTEVNDAVDKIVRRNRMNQLELEFGSEYAPIYIPSREYLNQFNLSYIKGDKLEHIILLCFSDILIIIEELTRKIFKWIKIDQKFFVRREQDNKFYRNMITIHSQGLLTFTAGSQDKNFNKIEEVYHLLKKLTKEGGQLVYVSVLGTEEIGSTSFSKHTEYIVEVKYLDLKKLLHIRFSEMNQIVHQMQTHYKDQLKITEEETLKKNWFNSHKSKTIQDRKRTIAQILQKMFNHELIKKDPNFLLSYLGLPSNFYSIARESIEKRMSLSNENGSLSSGQLTKKEKKEAFTILCGTQLKLGRDLFHDNDENLKKMKELAPKLQIYVNLMVDEPILIKITTLDSVEDVCNKVSKLIGLRSNRDFRLFHQIGKKELRVLEHEQIMTKLFTFPQKQEDLLIVGFIESIASSVKRVLSPDTFPTLIFKKYYYLPFDIEQTEVKKDLIRLKLIVYQIFAEIKEMKYQLIFDEYLLFLAMLIYIQADGQIDELQIDDKVVHRIVPDTVFKLKNYSESEWTDKVRPHLARLRKQIETVKAYNTQQINLQKIKVDSVSKTALYTGHRHLCSQIVLNKIKTNSIFGSNMFYTQPHSSTYDSLAKKGLKMAYNMWLAVKVESLNLLTPSSKECVLQLHYKDIQKIEVFSESITFKMDDYIGQDYRLNTYQSFEISQLVKYNKALNEILVEIKTNSELSSRIKLYREDLLMYRNTVEQGFESISMIK